ncbi:LacI family transcriptional regulator, partial [Cronobacter malonaticus]
AKKLLEEEIEQQIFTPKMMERDSVKDLTGAGEK